MVTEIIANILDRLKSTKNQQEDRIILRLDQNMACVYRSYNPENYFNQINTKNIQNIKVVYYRSPRQYDYHVVLKTGSRHQLLVGNRTHWLSKREAYWLAEELSQWLKVPVTEKEVINDIPY
ncbi:MAG: hypothetical protein WBA13_12010 [Microcoleaceae cyanobacterium]